MCKAAWHQSSQTPIAVDHPRPYRSAPPLPQATTPPLLLPGPLFSLPLHSLVRPPAAAPSPPLHWLPPPFVPLSASYPTCCYLAAAPHMRCMAS